MAPIHGPDSRITDSPQQKMDGPDSPDSPGGSSIHRPPRHGNPPSRATIRVRRFRIAPQRTAARGATRGRQGQQKRDKSSSKRMPGKDTTRKNAHYPIPGICDEPKDACPLFVFDLFDLYSHPHATPISRFAINSCHHNTSVCYHAAKWRCPNSNHCTSCRTDCQSVRTVWQTVLLCS